MYYTSYLNICRNALPNILLVVYVVMKISSGQEINRRTCLKTFKASSLFVPQEKQGKQEKQEKYAR